MKLKIFIILAILIIIFYYTRNIYKFCTLVNKILSYYCEDQSVFNPNDFLWSANFRSNYKTIKDEYLKYTETNIVPLYDNINKEVSYIDQQKKWKALFLRAYGKDTEVCKYFPQTMLLINLCPCTLAFFSVLSAGAKLDKHRGLYNGVIRYHLGLTVPDDYKNCFIVVDNKKMYWEEGSDLMFDDMYEHYVENNTNQTRIILFLDIQREYNNIFINNFNKLVLKYIKSNDALTETIDNVNKYVK